MSDIDKWKTQPCKECLLKKVCITWCFDWPISNIILKHIEKHQLEDTCLSCGSPNTTKYRYGIQWNCLNCSYREEYPGKINIYREYMT